VSNDIRIELAELAAAAVEPLLEALSGVAPERGAATLLSELPGESVDATAVTASAECIAGLEGRYRCIMTRAGVHRLASAMMGAEEGADEAEELSPLALSAAQEAMSQILATAAAAASRMLGRNVELSPTELVQTAAGDEPRAQRTARTSVSFVVLGEPMELVHILPDAATGLLESSARRARHAAVSASTLGDVPVRVWAELGRARMPIEQALGLAAGTLVDLDAGAEEPLQLYVNGRRFATGRLLLVDGEWAVRIDAITPESEHVTVPHAREGIHPEG
jgi:flagellar motor switch protein FliN/FliY